MSFPAADLGNSTSNDAKPDRAQSQATQLEAAAEALVKDPASVALQKEAGIVQGDTMAVFNQVKSQLNEYDKTAAKDHLPEVHLTTLLSNLSVMPNQAGLDKAAGQIEEYNLQHMMDPMARAGDLAEINVSGGPPNDRQDYSVTPEATQRTTPLEPISKDLDNWTHNVGSWIAHL